MADQSRIEQLISKTRFRYQDEGELQLGIAALLSREGISFEREVRITDKDRLDFLIDTLVIETKTKGSLAEVTRQLHRYAQHERVGALLLVTTRQCHRDLPPRMNGKPLSLLWIAGGSF